VTRLHGTYNEPNEWRDAIVWLAKEHFRDDWPKDSRYRVEITLMGCSRRGDIDNYAKAVLDALQTAGAFKNDNQVDDLQITRGKGRQKYTTISVSSGW
jgi:Holliday junction resolvase RusA-like endonuclease